METLVLKIVVLATLFVTCFVATLLPQGCVSFATKRQGGRADRHDLIDRLLRLLNCFGGGVFLATSMLDLLPDVREEFEEVFEELHVKSNFPISEFVIVVGFFLILTIEQAAYNFQERGVSPPADVRVVYDVEKSQARDKSKDPPEKTQTERTHLLQNSQDRANSSGVETSDDVEVVIASTSAGGTTETSAYGRNYPGGKETSSSSLRSVLLLLALSFHSVFEGFAIGLQKSQTQVLGIFAAVAIHKTILALSLGSTFVRGHLSKTAVFLSSFCFAAMAPIGIGLGILLLHGEAESVARSAASGVLQGIATGTFLYITFFEVLAKEIDEPRNRLLKVFCAIVGFGAIVGTMFLDPDIYP